MSFLNGHHNSWLWFMSLGVAINGALTSFKLDRHCVMTIIYDLDQPSSNNLKQLYLSIIFCSKN